MKNSKAQKMGEKRDGKMSLIRNCCLGCKLFYRLHSSRLHEKQVVSWAALISFLQPFFSYLHPPDKCRMYSAKCNAHRIPEQDKGLKSQKAQSRSKAIWPKGWRPFTVFTTNWENVSANSKSKGRRDFLQFLKLRLLNCAIKTQWFIQLI